MGFALFFAPFGFIFFGVGGRIEGVEEFWLEFSIGYSYFFRAKK